jgi:transcriptional regulator with XRE-family HTH domain
MPSPRHDFPGLEPDVSARFAADVAADEKAIVEMIAALRKQRKRAQEELAFVLGSSAGDLSRIERGLQSPTMRNVLRIARAMGFRARLVFEEAEGDTESARVGKHAVLHQRPATG